MAEPPSKDPGVFETMSTMRAMRRLRPDPVPIELVQRVIQAGTCAPSGQNTQPWTFLVVREPEAKRFIQKRYYDAMIERFGARLPRPEDDSAEARGYRAAMHLAEHLHEAPVLLLLCGRRDWPFVVREENRIGKAPPSYGSLYPCAQNVLLACRALGLAASLTTMHALFEDDLHERLGIPDDQGIVAMIPIGYPRGRFGPVRRRPVEAVTFYERWGERSPGSLSRGAPSPSDSSR